MGGIWEDWRAFKAAAKGGIQVMVEAGGLVGVGWYKTELEGKEMKNGADWRPQGPTPALSSFSPLLSPPHQTMASSSYPLSLPSLLHPGVASLSLNSGSYHPCTSSGN